MNARLAARNALKLRARAPYVGSQLHEFRSLDTAQRTRRLRRIRVGGNAKSQLILRLCRRLLNPAARSGVHGTIRRSSVSGTTALRATLRRGAEVVAALGALVSPPAPPASGPSLQQQRGRYNDWQRDRVVGDHHPPRVEPSAVRVAETDLSLLQVHAATTPNNSGNERTAARLSRRDLTRRVGPASVYRTPGTGRGWRAGHTRSGGTGPSRVFFGGGPRRRAKRWGGRRRGGTRPSRER